MLDLKYVDSLDVPVPRQVKYKQARDKRTVAVGDPYDLDYSKICDLLYLWEFL